MIIDFSNTEDLNSAIRQYTNYLNKLTEEGFLIVSEKIFVENNSLNVLSTIFRNSREFNKQGFFPSNIIFTHPKGRIPLSCIIIYAVRKKTDTFTIQPVFAKNRGTVIGRYLKTACVEMLYLSASTDHEMVTDDRFSTIFKEFEEAANRFQFPMNNMVRTWFYLGHISQNYEEFNHCRNLFYRTHQIGFSSSSSSLPASTCVGQHTEKDSLFAEAWFYKSTGYPLSISRILNPYQQEPDGENYLFKPAFSRALLIETNEYKELQLSGTASIGQKGETLFPDDVYYQIITTFSHITEILRQTNMNFSDFYISTAYLKNVEDEPIYRQALRDLNLELINHHLIFTDICRSELKFEFDGVAYKKNTNDEKDIIP